MKTKILITLILTVLLSSCVTQAGAPQTGTISVEQVQSWAKQTVEALSSTSSSTTTSATTVPTSNSIAIRPQASPTAKSLQLAQPTAIPTSIPTAIPTVRTNWQPTIGYVQPAVKPCDSMGFIDDITVPDNSVMAPNQTFQKVWRIQNIGSCTWTPAYQLVFMSGNSMSGPATVNLPRSVAPNQTIDIAVDLRAPGNPGEYQGNWVIRNASGATFGTGGTVNNGIWVKIAVQGSYPGYPVNPTWPVYPGYPTYPGQSGADGQCTLLSMTPSNNTVFSPGQETDFSWTVRNDSRITWDKSNFDVAYIGGTNMLKRKEGDRRDIPYDVLPGNPLSFAVDAVVPTNRGTFTMTYGVVQNFEIICSVSVTVIVQ